MSNKPQGLLLLEEILARREQLQKQHETERVVSMASKKKEWQAPHRNVGSSWRTRV